MSDGTILWVNPGFLFSIPIKRLEESAMKISCKNHRSYIKSL